MARKYNWKKPNRIEQTYFSQLQKLFKPIVQFIRSLNTPEEIINAINGITNSKSYNRNAENIAKTVSTMIYKDGAQSWREAAKKSTRSREIYEALQLEKQRLDAPLQLLMERNANIIKTLPLSISRKVIAHINSESMRGKRASDIAKEIQKFFPKTTKASAQLIARTETSKTSTMLTQVQSQELGIHWYAWRASIDARVRSSHSHMEGVLCHFSYPPAPEALIGEKSQGNYNAGEIYNCRCYAEPLIDYDQVKWPNKVHVNGRIQTLTLPQFKKLQQNTNN